jgi:flagellar basal-body rod protein FlgG
MDAQQMMVDTIANNIANANTNGFKKNQVNFQDLLYVKMQEAGREISAGVIAPSGMEVGSGVKTASTTKIFTPGEMQSTGNSLDMAIQGDGFFQVLLPNGEYRYTRDGSFQKDTNGLIVTSSGYQLSPGITVPSDATAVDISLDGTVSAELPSGSQVIGSIQLYRFPNNAGLTSEGGNLYRETGASGTAVSGNPGDRKSVV